MISSFFSLISKVVFIIFSWKFGNKCSVSCAVGSLLWRKQRLIQLSLSSFLNYCYGPSCESEIKFGLNWTVFVAAAQQYHWETHVGEELKNCLLPLYVLCAQKYLNVSVFVFLGFLFNSQQICFPQKILLPSYSEQTRVKLIVKVVACLLLYFCGRTRSDTSHAWTLCSLGPYDSQTRRPPDVKYAVGPWNILLTGVKRLLPFPPVPTSNKNVNFISDPLCNLYRAWVFTNIFVEEPSSIYCSDFVVFTFK